MFGEDRGQNASREAAQFSKRTGQLCIDDVEKGLGGLFVATRESKVDDQ